MNAAWRTWIGVLLWAAPAFALFAAGVLLDTQHGAAYLDTIEHAVGEIELDQALALDRAGFSGEAKIAYVHALDAEFAGMQNRAFALKELGELCLNDGSPQEAVLYFAASLDTGRAPISVYKYYVEALFTLGQHMQAVPIIEQWRTAAEAASHKLELSRAHEYAGRIALLRHDEQRAEDEFTAGNAALPGRGNALALARIAHERGENQIALERLNEVFLTGPEPENLEEALALRQQLLGAASM
ncbi:MAG: hypothetical protein HYV26_08880 [Candidatus Hydrogenedentes bacterium]|nr:hypothetical protein [Candidatus Hydrogenedentota bacterium]